MGNVNFVLAMAREPSSGGGTIISAIFFWMVIISIILIVINLVFSRGKKRSIVLKPSSKQLNDRAYKWFSIQGYEIIEQINNQKLKVSLRTITMPVFYGIGIFLCLFGLLPGVVWFFYQSGKITLVFDESADGTYLLATLDGSKSNYIYNQLVGALSMIDS